MKIQPHLGFLFSFLCVFHISAPLAADPGPALITGMVTDGESGVPLPGVNVLLERTSVGAAADEHGRYAIHNAPVGTWHLTASMVGYSPLRASIRVEAGQTITHDFELKPTVLQMGAVVVTGTATPHVMQDNPVRTEIIPRLTIEQKHASNFAEALSFHTGIRVENNCQNCNFSQVRILGMDGKYSQILIDGLPVVGSLASVYGLEHFPEEMVDQIEIVKGGGSSLYGGGAVAGVVNLITRRPLINQVRIKSQLNSSRGKLDHHVGAVAETVSKKGTSGAYVYGSFRNRDPYDRNEDGFSEFGELKNETVGFKWYYQPFNNGELLTSFHRIHEERRGGNKFDSPVHEADIAEWIEHWRTGGTVQWAHRPSPLFDYRTYYSFAVTNRESYYGGLGGDTPEDQLQALTFYGRTDNPLHIGGLQANYRVGGHLLTGGLQHSHDKLLDETAAETAYHIDDLYRNTGVFIQDNFHFGGNGELEFIAGVRFDKHSELAEWIASPRLTAKLALAEDITFRSSITSGFKPPQTYDEDLHLCGVEGDQRIIRNAPDLKEERSYSFSAGIEHTGYFSDVPLMVSVTGFATRLSDTFSEEFVRKEGTTELWERVNSDGARVRGFELDLGVRPITGVELRGGLTYAKSKLDKPNEDFDTTKFFRTPDLTANASLSYDATRRLTVYANAQYLGKALVPHEVGAEEGQDPLLLLAESDRYVHADIGATLRLPLNNGLDAKVNAGVKNIFDAFQDDLDVGRDRDPAYVYGPWQPRTMFIGLETSF
ncbi:TonB-dependent receptor [Candidatus Fermentibacteria bacterium]|nr:TonB-dependent receptor [Candidatus Fermentibacteria bacterium]